MRKIIGVTGLKGSGKTTAANRLIREHGFVRVPFAKPIKDMLKILGLEDVHLDGSLKEKPTRLLHGHTPRYAMQRLGTEFGREMIHPDIWITAWRHAVERLPNGQHVVADDLRFINELDMIERLNGRTVRIERIGCETADHASESGVSLLPVDETIYNDGLISDLYQSIDRVAEIA